MEDYKIVPRKATNRIDIMSRSLTRINTSGRFRISFSPHYPRYYTGTTWITLKLIEFLVNLPASSTGSVLELNKIGHMLIKCKDDDVSYPITENHRMKYAQLIKRARKVTLMMGHRADTLFTSDTIHDIMESNIQVYYEDGL
ncbi:hypothetical protein PENTCL1PPCAC_1036, partial [Pristionchus entomophagus]